MVLPAGPNTAQKPQTVGEAVTGNHSERNKGSKIEKLLIEIIELFIPLQKRW